MIYAFRLRLAVAAVSLGQHQHNKQEVCGIRAMGTLMLTSMMMIHSFSQMKRTHSPEHYEHLTVSEFRLKNCSFFFHIYKLKNTKVKD